MLLNGLSSPPGCILARSSHLHRLGFDDAQCSQTVDQDLAATTQRQEAILQERVQHAHAEVEHVRPCSRLSALSGRGSSGKGPHIPNLADAPADWLQAKQVAASHHRQQQEQTSETGIIGGGVEEGVPMLGARVQGQPTAAATGEGVTGSNTSSEGVETLSREVQEK